MKRHSAVKVYEVGEVLLIDMDKLSYGHPIFELAACSMPISDSPSSTTIRF
ncbi:MAG: hypothetical protein IKZ82_03175 [Clostridia bacterium]|nr:hypothetical protein [Clostridia bacterium]